MVPGLSRVVSVYFRLLLAFFLPVAPTALWGTQAKSDPLPAAALYSAEHSGDAVLVFRHDSLVFSQYQNGYDSLAPHPLASGTKTFTCAIAALAQQDKLLTLDEPVARTLPDFKDPRLKQLTIRQLLNLTSGLDADPVTGGLKLASHPGQRFAYGGTSFMVFAEVMKRKLKGEELLAYLTRRLFEPLGMTIGSWQRDGEGRPGLAAGASLTAKSWGKFGVLLLEQGRWQGKELLPRGALAECGKGSDANPYYGLGVWLNPAQPTRPAPAGVQRADSTDRIINTPDLPHDLLLAAGSGGQRLYILPSQGMVVVRFGHNTGPDYRDDEFLRLLLGKHQ